MNFEKDIANALGEAVIRLRPRMLRTLGQFSDNAELISAAADMTLQYLKQESDIDSNLAIEALRVTAIHGDDSVAREYLDAYKGSNDANFKTTLLSAMYFTDPVSITRILEFTQSDLVSSGDSLRPISMLFYANKVHAQLYDWLDENFDAVYEKAPDNWRVFLPQLTGGSCNSDNLKRTLAFYNERGENRPLPGLIEELIDFCEPVAADIGESHNLALARQILVDGPGYSRQLDAYSKNHSTLVVAENLTKQLLKPISA